MSVNKVILIGNVGKDPTIRYVAERPVAEFSLATTERARTTAAGVTVPERTEWHNIVMWDRNADTAENIFAKALSSTSRVNYAPAYGRIATPSNAPSPR